MGREVQDRQDDGKTDGLKGKKDGEGYRMGGREVGRWVSEAIRWR